MRNKRKGYQPTLQASPRCIVSNAIKPAVPSGTASFAVNSERQPRQLYPLCTFNTAYGAGKISHHPWS